MTNQEINHALALAIGWPEHDIDLSRDVCYVCVSPASLEWPSEWRIFDYKDPAVIWPIAVKFHAFPATDQSQRNCWNAKIGKWGQSYLSMCPKKAVALAVIDSRDR